jgi:hypothetical protein
VALLRKAIQLDPQFAMAYGRIGYAYSVMHFQPENGPPYLEKAFKIIGRLAEKDRLYIMAWYAIAREDYPANLSSSRTALNSSSCSKLLRLVRGETRSSIDPRLTGSTLRTFGERVER